MTKAFFNASLLAAVMIASAYSAPACDAASPSKSKTPAPKKCYQSYLQHLYYAKDLNDVSGYWANKRAGVWTSLKPDAKKRKLDYLRSTSYVGGNYKVVSEKIEGDTAHLVFNGYSCDSNKNKIHSRIDADLIQEKGFWKITDARTQYVGRPIVASRLPK